MIFAIDERPWFENFLAILARKRESPDFGVDLRGRMGFKRPRRGGRVVEGTPLLRAQMVKNRLEGSNPFFSATYLR